MQNSSITFPRHADRFLNLKASFFKMKKMLLAAAFWLAFAIFATPASGQVSITSNQPFGSFYTLVNTVTFTTAQTGLSASNFSVTGSIPGASVGNITGSGTSYNVYINIPNSFQSIGSVRLNMINSTGLSPGVSGLPVSGPSLETILYPLTGTLSLSSSNANSSYAKTGDLINYTLTSPNYTMEFWNVNIAGVQANGQSPSSGIVQSSVTLGSGTAQGPIAYSWSYTTTFNTGTNGSGTSSIIFDSVNPTVGISAPSVSTVNSAGGASVSYTVTYTDANLGNTNLTTSGITLNATGTATGTVGVSGSGASYTVTISNITGTGTLGISVGAGYAVDLAGNTEAAGAGPSSTVTVLPNVPSSISYTGTNLYPVNTAISPLTPVATISTSVFANTVAGTGLALDYNGNAYIIASSSEIFQYQPGNATAVPLPANSTSNIAFAPISSSTSTLLSAFNGAFRAMDITNGQFSPPVTACSAQPGGVTIVAAVHPSSGPEIAMINRGYNAGGQLAFLTRTAGTWSTPALISNAFPGSAIAINNYQGGLKLAYIGTDNNLYYATYTGGTWSAVSPWGTPNISLSGVTAFALDAQGDVWYGNGAALNELAPSSTSPITVATLASAPNAIAFDKAGNLYVNLGTTIEKLAVINNFQVSPALPAGLSINSTTGVISGTPTAVSAATNYTVTATAGSSNLTAAVNIATISTPTLSYGSPLNATIGTAITNVTPASGSIAVQKYNSTTATFANVNSPTGLTVDAAGNVYVNQINGISEIPAGGGTQTALNFGYPGPISVDGAGNLYVPNSLPGSPYAFAMHQGVSTTTFSGGGQPFLHQFKYTQGLAVDQAGNVYVCAAETNAVYEYPNRLSQNGFFNCFAIGTGFSSVSGVAADAAGNIYVSDAGAGAIDIIPANRAQWTTLVSGLGAPANICIDGAGNLYFSDNSANTISEIQAGSTTPVVIVSGLGLISALAIDGSGNLFAADAANQVLDKFSPNGGYYINPVLPAGLNFNGATGVISGTPTTASASANYTVIAYNTLGSVSATQNITVSAVLPTVSYGSARNFTTGLAIAAVTPSATGVATQGYSTIPTFIDFQFNYPYSVAVDTALNVGVTDLWDNNTHSTAGGTSGSYAQTIFPKGVGAPYFIGATNEQFIGMAADSTGDFYLSSQVFNQVEKFSPLPPPFTETITDMHNVWGLATDSHGNVYGAGVSNVFQLQGNTVNTLASGFSSALGIAVDGWGNVFVSDRDANTLYKIPAGSSTPSSVATGFNAPVQLAADATGNIFIADSGNGMIKELPAGGGGVATVISNLKNPNGVAVDVNGVLYVTDAGFSQVRKYAPGGGYYISPALPAGLSFNNSTGVISGTPTTVTPVKNYKITAYNASGSTQTTVRFGVTLPSSALAGLALSTGSLSPSFATGTTGYSASVPNSSSQITVTPTTVDANATVTVNGTAVTPGSPSAAIALSVGANTITVVVTASDHSSTQTYMVTVNRSGPSNNDKLSGAGISYIIAGDGSTEAVVTPSAADPNATVTVNGISVASGTASSPIPLSPGANTITIVVTAQDGLTKLTYKITVDGPLGSTSTLSALTISAGTLSPAFSPGTTSYTDVVNNNIASVTVTPTTTDPNATVTVNTAAVASGTPSAAIGLNIGNNTIATMVTAQDGVTTTTYTITVTRTLSANDNLSALAISSGTLSPAFNTGTTSYTANVTNAISTITLTPTVADATATIKINGVTVASGAASTAIPLNAGTNTITIVVTAADGVTTKTYTVTVTRAPSTNDNLSGLHPSVGALSPAFAGIATTSYSETVAATVSSITITPTTAQNTSTVTVNGTAVTSGSPSGAIALNMGSNTITVVVTAQDGATTKTYTITVGRGGTNDNLSALKLSSGTLSPTFAGATTTSYTASVANTVSSITVTPTTAQSTSTVTVNGTAVTTGSPSGAINLNVGANMINIVATAQDGIDSKTYTITVTRLASNNDNLSALKLSTGALSPAFAGTTITNYTAIVPATVSSITVTPTTAQNNATVTVNGIAVTSGSPSGAITLNTGPNTIHVTVTAQDGTTIQTYTVTVGKGATGDNLNNLTISSGTLSPAFSPGTTSGYTASVPNSVSSITVTPTTAQASATVTVNGSPVTSGTASNSINLVAGNNTTITTTVTAQNGVSSQSYTITITRGPSSDASLANLQLSNGTLTPAFATGTTSYNTSVISAVQTVTITPTTSDAGATVTVNGSPVSSGSPSANIGLAAGNNIITTIVTAQDGSTTQTYTLTLFRPSANANLSALRLSNGAVLSPTFSGINTTSYTASVGNGISSITVTPTASQTTSTVTVNGTAVTSGTASAAISLNVGDNMINTTVTAQDGTTTKTYTITVTRTGSNNANLSGLKLSNGAVLSPTFAGATTTSYTTSVANAISSITVTPTTAQTTSTVTVNGTAVASGTASGQITLNTGTNTITAMVTAQDGVTTKTYTVTVTRAGSINIPDETIAVEKPITSPQLNGGEPSVHQAISPNGDGVNDRLTIENITNYPDNKLTIINRNGTLIYEAKNYDNQTKAFDGHSSKTGQMQLPGTYFYSLEYTVKGETKHKTGFIVLKW